MKMDVPFPVSIDENKLFLYDPNDGFYNDLCYTYITQIGTDIILKDRRNEFIESNMTLCD